MIVILLPTALETIVFKNFNSSHAHMKPRSKMKTVVYVTFIRKFIIKTTPSIINHRQKSIYFIVSRIVFDRGTKVPENVIPADIEYPICKEKIKIPISLENQRRVKTKFVKYY